MPNSQKGEAHAADLKKGLTNDSAKASDSSTKCGSGSVNSEPTRNKTASSPGTLGPRTA